ncbi:hypothetical protein [Bradyrhizobium sp. 142]|nr:hypothetical protein [Bradyrhizobium sp. 142]
MKQAYGQWIGHLALQEAIARDPDLLVSELDSVMMRGLRRYDAEQGSSFR